MTGGRACLREPEHSYRSICSYRKLPPPACPGTAWICCVYIDIAKSFACYVAWNRWEPLGTTFWPGCTNGIKHCSVRNVGGIGWHGSTLPHKEDIRGCVPSESPQRSAITCLFVTCLLVYHHHHATFGVESHTRKNTLAASSSYSRACKQTCRTCNPHAGNRGFGVQLGGPGATHGLMRMMRPWLGHVGVGAIFVDVIWFPRL